MPEYRPEQRQIVCTILSTTGWLEATFHVPKASYFIDQLNVEHEFYRLTDFSFIHHENSVDFFALQKAATILVIPDASEDRLIQHVEETRPTRGFCLFEGGVVSGRIRIRKGIRISDFLVRREGFVLLENCTLRLGPADEGFPFSEEHPHILINTRNITGITEVDPFAEGA